MIFFLENLEKDLTPKKRLPPPGGEGVGGWGEALGWRGG
jgi:hypothetical protein